MDPADNRLHRFAEPPLKKYARDVHSQNGEDGILEEVLFRVGELRRGALAFECGAWDGKMYSNTYRLASEHGFDVIAVEGDPERFEELVATAAAAEAVPGHGKIVPVREWLDPARDSVGDILRRHGAGGLALMSIDIDGADYQVWERLADDVRPAVVVIEINSSYPPGVPGVHGVDGMVGTTFSSMLELGRRKGYALAAHTGNMIFVRDDLVDRLGLPGVNFRDPARLFDWRWWVNDVTIPEAIPEGQDVVGDVVRVEGEHDNAGASSTLN